MRTQPHTRKIASLIAAGLLTLAATVPAAAAPNDPGNPGDRGNRSCTWQGVVYMHGSTRQSPVVFMGNVIRYDYYQCNNASWHYIGSSDDQN